MKSGVEFRKRKLGHFSERSLKRIVDFALHKSHQRFDSKTLHFEFSKQSG